MANGQGELRLVAGASRRTRFPSLAVVFAIGAALIVGVVVGKTTTPANSQRSRSNGAAAFPRTRDGAVAALLDYGRALSDPRVLLDRTRRARLLEQIATPKYAQSFAGGGRAALDALRRGPLGRALAGGVESVYLAAPLAYRVVSYTPDRAVVAGWGVAVVATADRLNPQASWATSTATAVWSGGRWRVDAARASAGPTPALAGGEHASAPGDFLARLQGLRRVRSAP